MKLSVAMRVILGFGSITTLLLFAGASSLLSLNKLNDSQHQLTEIAEPISAANAKFRVELAVNREQLLESYYQDTSAALSNKRSLFDESSEALTESFRSLQQKTSGANLFNQSIAKLKPALEAYKAEATQALQYQANRLTAIESAAESISQMSNEADDASSYLLDLLDYCEESDHSKEQELADSVNDLEIAVTSALAANQDILTMTNTEQLKVAESKLDYLNKELKEHLSPLQEIQESFSDSDLLSDAVAGVKVILSKYLSEKAILKLKAHQIEQQIQARQMLVKLVETTESVIAAQDELNQEIAGFSQRAKQAVEDEVSSGTVLNSSVMVLSIILAVGIGFIVVRSIVRPLNEVNSMLHVIASGDLTQRLESQQKDEFGELANNVNVLIDNLRDLINAIVERSAQLGAAAEQTSAVTRQSTDAISKQRSMIEQVATATNEMSSTSKQVVNSADETLSAVKHADDEAEHIKELVSNTRNTMLSLAEEVKQASAVIDQLHGDSTSISSILDVIRGIAEQTNLLALNAAIEAARAGEQGRGFAVVADEVRSLASRTQESTQEIHNMIEKLQGGAQQAVTVMAQGQRMTEECVNQVEDSTNALQIITDSVHHAHDISSQINQAAVEQTDVTQQISEQLEQIVTLAEENTEAANQTASASQQVAHLSEELRNSIARFTV